MSYTRVTFAGYSMYPTLRPGDTLILDTVPVDDCSPGDIVCMDRTSGYVAHRIVRIDRDTAHPQIVTKGDNLAYSDPPIAPPQTLSRVVMISRGPRGLIRMRRGTVAAFLSRANLTAGLVRERFAGPLRVVRRYFRALLKRGAQLR